VLATFEREPELIDVVALHLLERHFAPGLHEEILEAVGLELGTPVATRRRDMAFRAAVLKAYLAECCVCGFSLRLVDGLIGVDAAHIRWHAHGGPDEVPNGLALCALHHRLFDHGANTVREDLRVRVARALAGSSARDLLTTILRIASLPDRASGAARDVPHRARRKSELRHSRQIRDVLSTALCRPAGGDRAPLGTSPDSTGRHGSN
jgi:HNH endonuclease